MIANEKIKFEQTVTELYGDNFLKSTKKAKKWEKMKDSN